MNTASAEQFSYWSERLNKSDEQAFSELFEHTYDSLRRYISKYIFDPDAALDVLQDVYVKLWSIRNTIDPNKSLKALMYQMVRNSALNYLRDTKDKNISLEHIPEQEHMEQPEEFEFNGADEASVLQIKMQQWIAELPERQREAFELSRFEGMSHEEIAHVMELKPRTVNNHIVIALNTLREKLDDFRSKSAVS
jgi:RNA polymerase sigma-70 factor (ECF subfamily)